MQIKEQIFYKILANGAKIVHLQTPSPVVYCGIMVGVGTRSESPEQNGMAHYIEHCVFKGTHRHTARQLIQEIEGIGGEINAYTTKEETTFYAATPREHYRHTMHLIGEMVMHPTFPRHETDKEVGVILDEIESYNDSPSELIYDDFESMIFRGHSLALPILGTKKTLRRISQSPDIPLRWMAEHYVPSRMVFFSSGNVSFATVERTVAAFFDGESGLSVESGQAGNAEFSGEAETAGIPMEPLVFRRKTHQTHIMLGGFAPRLGSDDQLCAYVLNSILGGGSLNSRLNLSLREKNGLCYTVESTYTPLSDTGYWCVYLACDPEDKERCLELVRRELEILRTTPLTEAQLRSVKKQIYGQMVIASENRENAALTMAKQMLYYGYSPSWQENYEKISHITADSLQKMAQKIYPPERIFVLQYI